MEKKYLIYQFSSCLFLLFFSISNAQVNINGNLKELNFFQGSNPKGLILVNDELIFSAKKTGSGNEPSKYNVQTKKFDIIKNIDGNFWDSMLKDEYYKVGDDVYFFASDNSNLQLWKTNLLTNSTSKIKDFGEYFYSSDITNAKVLNDKLIFTFKQELYVSNGTTEGTYKISGVNNIGKLCSNNQFIYFFGNSYSYGRELWKTDGTQNGTKIVKDIFPGSASSINTYNEKISSINNKVIFAASDAYSSNGLWSSDGTEEGTINFFPITNNFNYRFYDFDFQNQNQLIFSNNSIVWVTDGTTSGTYSTNHTIQNISRITPFKNNIYIETADKIYVKDTNNAIQDFQSPFGTSLQILALTDKNNYLVLKEKNDANSPLYFFDGNEVTKSNVKYADDKKFIEKSDKIYFAGYTESYTNHYTLYKNAELFHYNTQSKTDAKEFDIDYNSSSLPTNFVKHKDDIYFLASDGFYTQIFKTNANNDIEKLSNFVDFDHYNTYPFNSVIAGDYLYFEYRTNIFYRTKGTIETSEKIVLPANEMLLEIYPVNNDKVLIKTYNSLHGFMRLWVLNNNSTAIAQILEQPANYIHSTYDDEFVKTETGVYFKMLFNSQTEIWKSDGTIGNTKKITDVRSIYPHKVFLQNMDGKIFYFDNSLVNSEPVSLYYINDMTNQKVLVKNGQYYYASAGSFVKGNKLYFFSGTGNGFVNQLHVTDGTEDGTLPITEIQSQGVYGLKKCGDLHYFSDDQNYALFRTDGTSNGTFQVAHIYDDNTKHRNFNCINNELYYGYFGVSKTNGNQGNFQKVNFTVNGEEVPNLNNRNLFSDGEKLYFSAEYKDHGVELIITDVIESLSTNDANSSVSKTRILVYPNPTKNILNIKLDNGEKIHKIEFYDSIGRLVSTYNNSRINIENLATGVYFIKIKTSTKFYSTKVVKE